MEWYLAVMRNYAGFEGRARRKEYWMFLLMNFVAGMLVSIVAGITGLIFLPGLYYLATLIPSLAVGVRRLHDTGRSGWWLLISLVPLIGGIWLLVLLCSEGTHGPNEYGPDPKYNYAA